MKNWNTTVPYNRSLVQWSKISSNLLKLYRIYDGILGTAGILGGSLRSVLVCLLNHDIRANI